MTGVYPFILHASDGRERRMLVWFPTDEVCKDFYEKAAKCGLKLTIIE